MTPPTDPADPADPADTTDPAVPVRRVGTRALLVELPDLATAMSWHAALTDAPLPGQTEVGAAARTVLVRFDSASATTAARPVLAGFTPDATTASDPHEVTVDVVYDGADLDDLAAHLGMSRDGLIGWHTGTTWSAAFGGFAPGFTYCVPQDPGHALDVPRHASPRTAVPTGAVALAGDFSAVYPRTSPGGWQLLGTTTQPFWDAAAESPALLSPGDVVRYRAVTESIEITAGSGVPTATGPRRPVLRVDDPGLQILVEDAGRPGFGDLGVTTSGAADRGSAQAANEALGNDRDAAVLENIGGLTLTALCETVVVVTGSVLGSRSTDLLSGLGPAPLAAGDLVHAGPAAGSVRPVEAPVRTDGVLRVVPGPRDDWFTGGADALTGASWTVSGTSNRVGLRLTGEVPVAREHAGEIASEGMVAGSVQVPPDGQPVMFLRDHAVTGGYPVIATVIPEDLDAAAQLPPGTTVTFVEATEEFP